MNHFKVYTQFTLIIFSLLFSSVVLSAPLEVIVQDDTVKAPDVSSPPLIDGKGDDDCWQIVTWQSIDQVWIVYGVPVDSTDYWGRYKMVWSARENLLYFLVEIVDDIAVDGYIKGVTADYYNFDIIEVFIDEDKSGGLHVFDGTGSVGRQYGTNAENAFTYHIYAKFPADNEVTTEKNVMDIAGTDWSHYTNPDYAAHFPEFALRKTGNLYTREFSLIVYNDTYDHNNPAASRVQLQPGKIMGLSLAYCDNDNPNESPKTRDNFFGSVWVRPEAYNNHWMDADDFGTAHLISTTKISSPNEKFNHVPSFQIYPNPATNFIQLEMANDYLGRYSIKLFNIMGQEIYSISRTKNDRQIQEILSSNDLRPGIYFIEIGLEKQRLVRKVLITR